MTPDLAELRRLRDTEREELHSPTRRLDAYYYSFNETGSVPIDAILSAVAIAGKSCHNTDMWTEDDEWSRWGVGRSLVDVIQCAAYEAAAALLDAAAERDALAAKVERVTGELVDAGYRQAEDRTSIPMRDAEMRTSPLSPKRHLVAGMTAQQAAKAQHPRHGKPLPCAPWPGLVWRG